MSTPPEPPPRRRYLHRPPAEPSSVDWTPHDVAAPRPTTDRPPREQPRGPGPRWPSSPALDAAARERSPAAGSAVSASGFPASGPSRPLFLRRVVVAGDEYDDVIDDVTAYGLKRSKRETGAVVSAF